MTDKLTISKNENPVQIITTWDAARGWLEGARQMELRKVFCQVMFGFTIIALHKEHGVENGLKTDLSHDGKGMAWEDVLEKETGLSKSSAYRYMDMAKCALPRLRKHPLLRNYNPETEAPSSLTGEKKTALETVVKKLTDGVTQKEFGENAGIWKKPQGSGAKGRKPGEGGRKKLTPSEMAELLLKQAVEDWAPIADALRAYGAKFMALPQDSMTEAQIADMEAPSMARKAWLKVAPNDRDKKLREQVEGMVTL